MCVTEHRERETERTPNDPKRNRPTRPLLAFGTTVFEEQDQRQYISRCNEDGHPLRFLPQQPNRQVPEPSSCKDLRRWRNTITHVHVLGARRVKPEADPTSRSGPQLLMRADPWVYTAGLYGRRPALTQGIDYSCLHTCSERTQLKWACGRLAGNGPGTAYC